MGNKISKVDFDYLVNYERNMRNFHEEEFLARIEPDRIKKYYESERLVADWDSQNLGTDQAKVNRISLNKFFPATQTLLSVLYPQNPKWLITPKRPEIDDFSARIAEAGLEYYFGELNAEDENKDAILNAWFFGFGCIKQGWRQTFASIPKEEVASSRGLQKLVAKAKQAFSGGVNLEQEEVIIEDGPFLESVSPLDIELDHKRPFGKGKFIVHRVCRTLDEVLRSDLYTSGREFAEKFRNNNDDREIDLDLREMWSLDNKGFMRVTTFVEDWNKPLRHTEMGYMSEGFPFQLLRLQDSPGKYSDERSNSSGLLTGGSVNVYPMSHFRVGMKAQREIDYILTLWLKNIDKFRSQTLVNKKIFADEKQGMNVLEENQIGGIAYTDRSATAGDVVNIGSTPIKQEMPAILDVLQGNMQEILSVTGARMSGRSKLPTATQEQITESGNEMRTLGMKQHIKDFLNRQGRKMLQDLKQFATAPVLFKITGMNIQDPQTGKLVTDIWREFGTEDNPQALKEAIRGEFDLDVDMSERRQRDLISMKQELTDILQFLANPVVLQLITMEGSRLKMSKLVVDILGKSQVLNNPQQYLETITPEQQQALSQLMLSQSGGREAGDEGSKEEKQSNRVASGGVA